MLAVVAMSYEEEAELMNAVSINIIKYTFTIFPPDYENETNNVCPILIFASSQPAVPNCYSFIIIWSL